MEIIGGDLMVVIQRPKYLAFLKEYRDTPDLIKVITGVRRSGKTYLMQMYVDWLRRQGVDDSQIIQLNFENFAYAKLNTAEALYEYIQVQKHPTKRTYLFLDEIQHVKDWQRVINSCRIDMDADIYITGSNGYLLSGELATLLTGRYVELTIYPLSFREYYDFKQGTPTKAYQLLMDYVLDGGFPAVALADNDQIKTALKKGIFDSIILSDIAMRANTRNEATLVAMADYLLSEVGNPMATTKIANVMKANGYRITPTTVIDYLQLFEESFLFYKTVRYDLRGKKWLSTNSKYYVADLGLRNTRLNKGATDNLGHQLENLVYLELRRRGYEVNVGKLSELEINFVARRGTTVKYYQVTQQLPDQSRRETANLLKLNDAYKKVVLTLNQFETGMVDGVKVKYLVDWLLAE